jgi:hypothetical protein
MAKLTGICLALLFASPSALAQWTRVPFSPTSYIQVIVDYHGVLYLGHGSSGVYKSIDSAQTWQLKSNGLANGQARAVYQLLASGDTLFAATMDGIYKSTNGGDDWVRKSNGIIIGPGALYAFCESIFDFKGTLFTGAWNGIYRSTDRAENWTLTNVTGEGIGAKGFVAYNGALFAARETNNSPGMYTSTDDGLTWTGRQVPFYNGITFLPDHDRLWAGAILGVWLSTDNGATWTARNNGLTPDPYSSSMLRIGNQLVTSLKFGGSGMYRSDDDGLHWHAWQEGLPFLTTIDRIIVYGDRILAGTSDGLWQRRFAELPTGVKEAEADPPTRFELAQNYPNPFNPTTTIRYGIPRVATVTLSVFNLLGQQVARPVHEIQTAGYHSVEFDGSALANGTYYYRLQAGEFADVKRLLLLK